MSDILKALGENLSKSLKEEDLSKEKKNIEKPQVVNEYTDYHGNISIGYDSVYMETLIKQKVPVDVWNYDNWRNLIKQIYESVFRKNFPYTRKQFNLFFSELVIEARENYEMSNYEIKDFLIWTSNNYLEYIKKNNKPFNLRNVRYSLPNFYEREITPKIERENLINTKIRNFPIDCSDIKLSIDKYYEKDVSILTRQLGFVVMLHYLQKFVYDKDIKKAYTFLIREIDKRCQIEQTYFNTIDDYMDQVLKNTLYLGPYSFEEKLNEVVPSWRKTFKGYISSRNMSSKGWWMEVYFPRDPIPCIEKFSRKKLMKKKVQEII